MIISIFLASCLHGVIAQVCTGSCGPISIVPPVNTITAVIGNGPLNISVGYPHIAFHTQKLDFGMAFVNSKLSQGTNISLQLVYSGVLDPNDYHKLPTNSIPHSPELYSEVMGINIAKGVIVSMTNYMTGNFYTKKYTIQSQIPLQAYDDVSSNNEWYGVPRVADIRGLNVNITTFEYCGLKLPPPLDMNWTLPYSESWNWYTFVNYTRDLHKCGVLIPYWLIECSTHPFIMAIIQSFGGSLLKTDGTSNIMSDNVYKATSDIIVPFLKYGGKEMVSNMINASAPGMTAYLENPSRDFSIPAYLGQTTCDIPTDQPIGMSQTTAGKSGISSSATPGQYTPGFYWSMTMSKAALADNVSDIVWDWILFNSDFGSDSTFAYNYYKSKNTIPVMLNGRNKPFFQNLASKSTTWLYNQPKGYSMLYPNNANEWIARFEEEGRLNMYIACLSPYHENQGIDYCRMRLHKSVNYLALRQCRNDDLIMVLSVCESGGSIGFRYVDAQWDKAKLNITCRADETPLPTMYNSIIECDYWDEASSYSFLLTIMSSIAVVIQVCAGLMVAHHRKNPRIKARSWVFSEVIFLGCLLLSSAPYMFPGKISARGCAYAMIALTTGVTVIICALVIKTYRIYTIFMKQSVKITTVRLRDGRMILYLFVLMIPHVILILVYLGMESYERNVTNTVLLEGDLTMSVITDLCYYGENWMLITWSSYWAFMLISLLYMTVSVSKEFSEGTSLGDLYHLLTEKTFLRSLSYVIFMVCSIYLPMVVLIINDAKVKLVFTGIIGDVVSIIITTVYIYSDASSIFFPSASVIGGGRYETRVSDGAIPRIAVINIKGSVEENRSFVITHSPTSPHIPTKVIT